MFTKLDGILAVVAVLIVVHLAGEYTDYVPKDQNGNPEVVQQVQEEPMDEEIVEDEDYEQDINAPGLSQASENDQLSEEREEERMEQEAAEQEQIEADQEAEAVQQQVSSKANRSISADLYDLLSESMDGDPYISDRYLLVVVDTATHIVEVSVDETTFGSLDVDSKASAYKAVSQEVQQHYLDLLSEFSNEQPEEVIVELQDSNRDPLATYKKDSFGDRYTLTMEHTNDNNF